MNLKNIFYTLKFIKHNRKIFNKNTISKNKEKLNFLVEFNAFHYYHIILPYLVNFFRNNFKSNFFAYSSHMLLSYPIEESYIKKLKIFFLKLFNIGVYGIYKSCGIRNFLKFKFDKITISKAKSAINKIKLKNKKDILKIKINNIFIGDLIYDTYLKKYKDKIPDIDVKSNKFLFFLNEFICLYFLWEKIIKEKKINRIIISHSEYTLGLPARVCFGKGGVGYLIGFDRFIKLNKKNFFHFSSSKYYKKNFKKFTIDQKKNFIKQARKQLNERVSGSVNDIPYMTKSAYKIKNKIKQNNFNKIYNFKNKNAMKVLITTHDFVDAPHSHGKFIFPDMVEWLKYLANLSKKTNYIWFIKNHPAMNDKWKDYQQYTRGVVSNLIKDSNLILLDSNIPHNYLIKNIGIDCVLTVWGQIAHEYAYKKIPVINASNNNIHASFNFNFHANSIKHYTYLIKNFSKLKKKLDYDEVFQFYYMHYINADKNWFFNNFNKFLKRINGYHNLCSTNIYKEWIESYDNNTQKRITDNLENFIKSDSLVLSKEKIKE